MIPPDQRERSIQQIEDERLIPLYNKRDIDIKSGQGMHVFDSDGKQYLDLTSQYGVNILGHSHPAFIEALTEQARLLTNAHSSFYSEPRALVADKLHGIFYPDQLTRFFFCSSGAEAIEASLKFARAQDPDRRKVIAAKRAYHGRTMGALDTTHDRKYRDPYEPMMGRTTHVGYGNIDELEAAMGDDSLAVILEPIQGEGGIHVPPADYLPAVRELCDKNGALLIFDEVQTAFRTGEWLAGHHTGVVPDILAVSKGLAGGLPMGVVAVKEDVSKKVPPGTHGNTFGGNPLVCATSLAVINTIEREGLLDHSAQMGEYFRQSLKDSLGNRVRNIRGEGLMIGVELKERNTRVLKGLQDQGILALPAGSLTLRFLPPLIIQKEHIDQAVNALSALL